MEKIAIFCTADDKFIRPAIVALKSFERFHTRDLFIVSFGLNEQSIQLLDDHGIKQIKANRPKYVNLESNRWPADTYLMLWAPELFYNLGYKYSIGIDADVLCIKRLDLDAIFPCKTFAALKLESTTLLYNLINGAFGTLEWYDMGDNRPQSGVIFWNNAWADYVDGRGLWERSMDNITRYGIHRFKCADQSLLASIGHSFKHLPEEYNSRVIIKGRPVKIDLDRARIIHYVGKNKPWNSDIRYGKLWRDYADSLNIHT